LLDVSLWEYVNLSGDVIQEMLEVDAEVFRKMNGWQIQVFRSRGIAIVVRRGCGLRSRCTGIWVYLGEGRRKAGGRRRQK
jgi:hypothetical protein